MEQITIPQLILFCFALIILIAVVVWEMTDKADVEDTYSYDSDHRSFDTDFFE